MSELLKGVPIQFNFNGVAAYGTITVSEVGGKLNIKKGYCGETELKTKAAIDKLGDECMFVGQNDDEALAMWL